MDSPFDRIARMILHRRQKLLLSQRQVASELGCSQAYLAQIETGKRPVSKKIAEQLEVLFKVKPGKYSEVDFRRGRPPLTEEQRAAAQKLREARQAKAAKALERARLSEERRAAKALERARLAKERRAARALQKKLKAQELRAAKALQKKLKAKEKRAAKALEKKLKAKARAKIRKAKAKATAKPKTRKTWTRRTQTP